MHHTAASTSGDAVEHVQPSFSRRHVDVSGGWEAGKASTSQKGTRPWERWATRLTTEKIDGSGAPQMSGRGGWLAGRVERGGAGGISILHDSSAVLLPRQDVIDNRLLEI